MASKGKRTRRRKEDRGAADAAYRRALGLGEHENLPAKIGQATSGGGGRGGRGSAQRGKGHNS